MQGQVDRLAFVVNLYPHLLFKINCHICLTVKNENLIALELSQLTTEEHGGGGPKNSEKQYGKPLLQLLT